MKTNNVWEVAEAWITGTLTQQEKEELNQQMETDAAFASEFNENINLLNSLNGLGRQSRFRTMLGQIHQEAAKPKKARILQLPPHFWRTSAIAAGVALFTSLLSASLFVTLSHQSESQYRTISREMEHIKRVQAKQEQQQNAIIDSIKKKNIIAPPPSEVRFTGTGFAITNNGYFATAYHVINQGKFDSVYIECSDNKYYKANLVTFDAASDLAILKVERKNFHFGHAEVPYKIVPVKSGLGARIFTIGYPNDDLVYSEGYISGKNGYNGNAQQYTLDLPAGHGQSGSPVADAQGNVIGILTAISGPEEANTYAVSSKSLIDLIKPFAQDNDDFHVPVANKLSRLSREEQIEKMENYTFSVKVYKK
jgi:serine protease Do